MNKLAIITSHPIQYYAPWFSYLAKTNNLAIKVFYLWNFGITQKVDPEFKKSFQWDIPLLEGYEYEFIPNVSKNPGTHHFWGLQNPSLISQIKSYHPDAVLLMTYNFVSIYNFLWKWNSKKVPLLFRGDSHRLIFKNNIKEKIKRNFITQIYRHFSAYLYVGKANYDYFRYHNIPPEKLFFSPHAIDNQRFFNQAQEAFEQAKVWKQELGIPENYKIILFAGKFNTKKRPLDLLDAFIKANLSEVSLLFVGNGELEKELKEKATKHKNIYFAPFQNQSFMPRTYAIADLFVLPSYGSGETWGRVINEAMCMSCPIIASTHVGCAQNLISLNKNGLIFPAGDVSALTNSLQEAFSNRERLQEWGKVSRKIIEDYSYTQTTQGLQEALNYLNIS